MLTVVKILILDFYFLLMTECMDDKALPEGWPESCQSLDQSLQIFVKIWEERTASRQNQLNCA